MVAVKSLKKTRVVTEIHCVLNCAKKKSIKHKNRTYTSRVVDISLGLKDRIGKIAQNENIEKMMRSSPHHSIYVQPL